ncbi:MAG: MFS transporter [Myxococcota bacterium]
MLFLPLAGVLVDRWGQRKAMLIGHGGAGVCSLIIALLLSTTSLSIAGLVAMIVVTAMFASLLLPAGISVIALLVSKKQIPRANGMMQLAIGVGGVLSPLIAGSLYSVIGLRGILIIDVTTFIFALIVIAFISIPRPAQRDRQGAQGKTAASSPRGKKMPRSGGAAEGWLFIRTRPGLFGLMLLSTAINFNLGMVQLLATPLILGFANVQALGTILSVGGVGTMLGSIAMIVWGGPKRLIHGVLLFAILQGTFLIIGVIRPSLVLLGGAAFFIFAAVPINLGCNLAIWQRKVPTRMQGRVLAIRAVGAKLSIPLSYLVAGPLADYIFEPAMAEGGALAGVLGPILGTGQSRGIALLFIVLGLLTIATSIIGYLYPRIRLVENELSDHDESSQAAADDDQNRNSDDDRVFSESDIPAEAKTKADSAHPTTGANTPDNQPTDSKEIHKP